MKDQREEGKPGVALTTFDVTSLVVGAVVGADIYVVASLGAGLLGPAMLVAWVITGVMAGFIALSFAQCVAIVPRAGGPYAYGREAFGYFPGFLLGWALYLAELVAISVFPVAFVRYLRFFVSDISWWEDALAKVVFVAFLTATNYLGTRTAGRINDALAIAKLGPLFLLILLGVILSVVSPSTVSSNLEPFVPLGWGGLGGAIVLAFWAYAGFELAVLPAGEIANARRALPLAMAWGMAIVTVFYVAVNATVVMAMPWSTLTESPAPLATAMEAIVTSLYLPGASIGAGIMAAGAILSISGADESATLGSSRLCYAMAADGYFPRFFASLDPKRGTPYVALIFQAGFALAASLVGSLNGLIGVSVFFLALVYIGTSLAAMRLVALTPEGRLRFSGSRLVHLIALASSVYILLQTELATLLLGVLALAAGVLVYLWFAPKTEVAALKRQILSTQYLLAAVERALMVAPAHAMQHIRQLFQRNYSPRP
ncbi:MAG: amino acid permease [Chloroflexi bacterium]|nr:amino acid permease [Chloroflexota bacterium]